MDTLFTKFVVVATVTSYLFQQLFGRVQLPDDIAAIWFTNWAQYRSDDYQFYPSNLTGTSIINDVDIIYYGFAFFCPNSSMFQPYWITQLQRCQDQGKNPFEIIWIEPNDVNFYQQLTAMKSTNSNLKIVLSIGGWNFPSNFFSVMVSNNASRNTFIQSAKQVLEAYQLDGIDIDWEYPGSKPRLDPVEIYCSKFDNVTDYGGTYNNPSIDATNFVTFMKELRDGLGEDYLITFCGQAGLNHVRAGFYVEELVKYVDLINVMTYDYTVSNTNDKNESEYTAPNEPLYQPKSAIDSGIAQWNLNSTINGYIELGAPPSQLLVGIAYYGHTWYIPGLSVSDVSSWNHYGLNATKPNVDDASNCCETLKNTYGGSAGIQSLQCGFNGYYEITNAGFLDNAIIDNETMTYISYIDKEGNDNWTPAYTWINFQGIESIKSIINFTSKLKLRGAFGFDISIDSFDTQNKEWTFDLTNQMIQCVKQGC